MDERLRPFTHFMSFLADKRSLNIRKAERQSNGSSKSKYSSDRKSVRSMYAEGSGSKSNDTPKPPPKDIHCVITKIALVIGQQTAVSSKVYLLVRSMML